MRISDWSSDVCSSDLGEFLRLERFGDGPRMRPFGMIVPDVQPVASDLPFRQMLKQQPARDAPRLGIVTRREPDQARDLLRLPEIMLGGLADRSEEHTSELQSLMRIQYAVFCLKKENNT